MIDYGELSDSLARLVKLQILQRREDKFPFPRGRPSDGLSSETGGRRSYYEFSELKKLVKEVLDDANIIKLINKKLIAGKNLFPFLVYSFASCFYQIRENEQAFLNTFKPYGLSQKQLYLNEKKQGTWILFKDLSNTNLEGLAERYAKQTLENWGKSNQSIVYQIAIILNLNKVYPDLQ